MLGTSLEEWRHYVTPRRDILAFSGGADAEVCVDSEEVLQPFFLCEPPEQVRLFILLFCVSIVLGLVKHHANAVRYYRMFAASKIPPSLHRGFGYNACKAYGIVPIPRLSIAQFQLVGWLLLATLLLACHSGLAPRFFLFASFGLYFLYFGQLFCESKHGGHGSLLLPSVIMFLALSGGPQSTPWSLVFVKIFLGVVYFAGAVSKVVVSAFFGRPWCGATMQAYLFDGMWSRPTRSSLVRALQNFLLTRWWACSGMAVAALVFEFGFLPLCLLGGHIGGALAAAVAVSFHFGVDLLQGLDFMPFWCPVFWAFLPDLQALVSGHNPGPDGAWYAVMAQGYEEEPCRWVLSAIYLTLQVIVSVRFADLSRDAESLPLTCCPMFAVPRNIFSDEVRAGVMTDVDLRDGGHLDLAYNFSPWHVVHPMSEDDLKQLPGRVLIWMSSLHFHPLLKGYVREEFAKKDLLIAANFDVSPELRSRIRDLVHYLDSCQAEDWSDRLKASEAVVLQEQCRALFDEQRGAGSCGGSCVAPEDVAPALLSAGKVVPAGAFRKM